MYQKENSFIVLYAKDIDRTRLFYEGLGFTPQEQTSEKLVVVFGSFELHFVLASSEPSSDYRYITEPPYGQGAIFYIESDDIEASHDQVKSLGGLLKTDVFQNHWGSKEFLFEDPNGYKFAIYN